MFGRLQKPFPVRIEFFGDEIDTLRQFDPGSQRTIRPMDDLLITPAREILPDKSDHEFRPTSTWMNSISL